MTTIHYIANQDNLAIQHLKPYLQEQSIQLEAYDLNSLPKVDYLLIAKPIKVDLGNAAGFKYCSYSSIWHRWLFKNAPETVLLSVGYAEQNGHLNYIDLLNLKPDFTEHLIAAKPAGSFGIYTNPQNSEQYIDEWQQVSISAVSTNEKWEPLSKSGLPIRGVNIIRRLKHFFDGHDTSRSIQKHLTDLKQTLSIMQYKLKKGEDYKIVQKNILEKFGTEEWKTLYSRWQVYKFFFDYTPFIDIRSLDGSIDEFDNFMSNLPNDTGAFSMFDPHEKITSIFDTIEENVHTYVSEKAFCTA